MRVGENEMKEYNILVRLFGRLFGLMSTLVSCGRWQIIYSSDSILILIKGTLRLGNHWENLQLYLRRHWCCVRLLLPPSLHALLLAMDQCPARVGFGQSRSEKWRKNAIHSFREVQVKKNALRSRSRNENDWKSRLRSESEIKIAGEVKFKRNTRESRLSQVSDSTHYTATRWPYF